MKRRRVAEPRDEALAEAHDLERLHAGEALEDLVQLAREAESDATRVSAIKEILDRAYGRPVAPPSAAGGAPRHVLVDDGYRD